MELLLVVNVNSGRVAIDLGCMSGNMRMAAREVCLVQVNVEISLEVKADFLAQVSRVFFLAASEDF